jgi:hypothetical protein
MFCDLMGSTMMSAALDTEDWRNLVIGSRTLSRAARAETAKPLANIHAALLVARQGFRLVAGSCPAAGLTRQRAIT